VDLLYHIVVECSSISEERTASIFRVTESGWCWCRFSWDQITDTAVTSQLFKHPHEPCSVTQKMRAVRCAETSGSFLLRRSRNAKYDHKVIE